jgi:hypothetical protein
MRDRWMRATLTVIGGAAIAIMLGASAAWAVGGDDANTANKVDKNTQLCRQELGKKARLWAQKRIDNLNACLDAILKCDEQTSSAKADACRAKLIEDAKGKCAQGKLDSGATTLGAGASVGKLKNDKPTLDKELAKYRDALAKKCFDPNKPVDLTSLSNGLGFAAAANADALMDQVNSNPGGIGCLANEVVRVTDPNSDSVIAVVLAFEDGTHHGAKAIKEGPGNAGIKSCLVALPGSFLDFTTGPPDLVGCVSGHGYDATVGGSIVKTLHCGGLNIGGGPSTVAEGATPENATSRFAITGCAGSVCTLGPTLAAGVGFDCTNTGCRFGPPLPITNAGTSTCVLNTFLGAGGGTIDVSTGGGSTIVPLSSNVFLTGNAAAPCPRCVGGFCERGPNAGAACTTSNAAGTSNACQPDGTNLGMISVDLTPLTGGLAVKTDAGGLFCPGQGAPTNPAAGPKPGCFGSITCKRVEEQGTLAGALTLNVPAAARLASVFCIPETPGALGTLINLAAGLPGPGATSLPGTLTLRP